MQITMGRPSVLITGYPKFSNFDNNVSEKILSIIREIDFSDIDIFTELLSVDEEGSELVAKKIDLGHNFDTIIHLGFSSKSKKLRFEKYAYNEYNMSHSDNSGRCVSSGAIIQSQITRHRTNVNEIVINEVFQDDPRVEWSINPGRFVCNETYFKTLNMVKKQNNKTKVIFVHLPPENIINIGEQTEIIERLIRCITKLYVEVVGALIFDENDRILSCRRPKGKSWPSWWEFPGGKIELGETPFQALSRELKEELSLNVSPSKIIAEQFFDYEDKYVKLMVLNCGIIKEEQIELVEHDKMRWLYKHELFEVNWLPADLPIIEEWFVEGIPSPHQY
jgi:8-oxo-dGTP diphosphatase